MEIPEHVQGFVPGVPTHVCLLPDDDVHGPHSWWYTSWGGGHMMWDDDPTEKNTKQWNCPGITYQPKHRRNDVH